MYRRYLEQDSPNIEINMSDSGQTLLYCRNFEEKEIKEVLVNTL